MKATVIKKAFFKGRRVRPGDKIDVPDDMRGSWFTTTAAPTPTPKDAAEAPPKAKKGRRVEPTPASFRDIAEADEADGENLAG